MKRIGALLVAGACALAGACDDKPSKDDCEKLMSHLVDLELRSGGVGAVAGEGKDDTSRQRDQVLQFVRDTRFVETCTQKTPRSVVDCGLAVKSRDEIAACDDRR